MLAKTLSTLEMARHFCDAVPHNRDLGIEIVSMENELATMRLKPHPGLLGDSSRNLVFNSVALSLADACSGLAVFVATKTLLPISTLDLRMDYLRAAPGHQAMTAIASCYRHTAEIAFVRCSVYSEGIAEPVAIGSSVFMRAKEGGKGQEVWKAAFEKGSSSDVEVGIHHRKPKLSASQSIAEVSAAGENSNHQDEECDDLRRLVEQLPYAQHLGLRIAMVSGIRYLKMPYRSELVGNMMLPALHGGALGALMEIAALIACQRLDSLRRMPKLVDSTIDYLRSGKAKDTYALATIVRSGQRVITVHVECWQDDPSNVIAIMRMQLLVPGSNPQ